MTHYIVWCPNLGGSEPDGQKIVAPDEESAACSWAMNEDYRSANFRIASGATETVFVRQVDCSIVRKFEVTGEAVPQYFATLVPHE